MQLQITLHWLMVEKRHLHLMHSRIPLHSMLCQRVHFLIWQQVGVPLLIKKGDWL